MGLAKRFGGSFDLYGKLNAYKTFDGEKRLAASGTTLSYEESDWLGEAGLGGVYNWGQGKYAVSGEVGYTSDLGGGGDFESVNLSLNWNMKW